MSQQLTQQLDNIYTLLPKAMGMLGAIGKTGKNTAQNYSFRGIDDILNHVKPVFADLGISVMPEVREIIREERTTKGGTAMTSTTLKVAYSFYAPDGSSLTAVTTGEGTDSGDKSCNKALSGAFKYALTQVLCIATQDMSDSENESPEPSVKAAIQPVKTVSVDKTTGEVFQTATPATQAQIKEMGEFAAKHGWNEVMLREHCLKYPGVTRLNFMKAFTLEMLSDTKAAILQDEASKDIFETAPSA